VDDENLTKRYPAFKKEILRMPGVSNMTASNFVPWQYGFMLSFAFYNRDVAARAQTLTVDSSFLTTYQIPIIYGEGFRTEWIENDRRVIINETAYNILQSSGTNPLSKYIGISSASHWRNRVQGVAKDFYCFYPTKKIRPLAFLSTRSLRMGREYMTIRLANDGQSNSLSSIEKTVERFFPKSPFEYKYVSREMERLHNQEIGYRLIALVVITGFMLLIAGVGLLGFANYESERSTKEIGIRKALGAKPMQISIHYIFRFAKLTLIANVIAWPICYLIIQWILKIIHYPHPIHIAFTRFLLAGLLTEVLTIAAVWVQSFRAASADPVKALRYE
jgi:ABC-type antimicrobial peptide transport system permease subunit